MDGWDAEELELYEVLRKLGLSDFEAEVSAMSVGDTLGGLGSLAGAGGGVSRGRSAPKSRAQAAFLHERVRAALPAWERLGASKVVLGWIRDGVRLNFKGGRAPAPFDMANYDELTPEQKVFMDAEVERMVAVGAWEDTSDADYVSPMFLVPKKGGGWRLVVDLRWLNEHCEERTCAYESLKAVRRLARQGDFMFSWDVEDGFYHLSVHESERKFFTFRVGDRLMRCACLPMGWRASPYYFTKLMRVMVGYLRAPAVVRERAVLQRLGVKRGAKKAKMRRGRGVVTSGPWRHRTVGLRVLPYVDDFLGFCETEEDAMAARDFVGETMEELAISRKAGKGQWDLPVQRLEHLGMVVDTKQAVFQVTPARCGKLRTLAKDILCRASRDRRLISRKALQSFCGLGNSTSLACPAARFYLRELYTVCASASAHWSGKVRLTAQAWRDLEWWSDFGRSERETRRAIWRSPDTATLHCDASKEGHKGGWGGCTTARRRHAASGARTSWCTTSRCWSSRQ